MFTEAREKVPSNNKDKERTNTMHKFNIGDRVVTNGSTPRDNTKVLTPELYGTVVGYDTDGKNIVKMDGDSELSYIADHELNPTRKYKVRITRTETYYRDVEVEADNIEDAIEKAEENEQDNEYAELFDCPDDVQTSFKDANGNEKGE